MAKITYWEYSKKDLLYEEKMMRVLTDYYFDTNYPYDDNVELFREEAEEALRFAVDFCGGCASFIIAKE